MTSAEQRAERREMPMRAPRARRRRRRMHAIHGDAHYFDDFPNTQSARMLADTTRDVT